MYVRSGREERRRMGKNKLCFLSFAAIAFVVLVISQNLYARAEKNIEKEKIISFEKLKKEEYVYSAKPDEKQLESIFPEEVQAVLSDGTCVDVKVHWYSEVDLSVANRDVYIFHANLDDERYLLEETARLPQIKIVIRREEVRAMLKSGKKYKLLQKSTKYYNGLLRVGYFEIQTEEGRKHAMCAQHQLDSPKVNEMLTETTVFTKQTDKNSKISRLIRKVMYYGWGGPADIGPKPNTSGGKGQDKESMNDGTHYRRTALAVSVANRNEDNTFGYGQRFIEYLEKNYPDAPEGFDVHLLRAPRADNQDLVFYTYKPDGNLKLKKVSSEPELSRRNECYSFKGAQFGVYTKYQEASGVLTGEVGRLETDDQGISNTLTLQTGTYYVKELKAPTGFALNSEVQTVQVTPGITTTVEFADYPQYAPLEILLRKVAQGEPEEGNSFYGSLEHAEFTVHFYAGLWEENVDPKQLGKKPIRSWVFDTDKNGIAKYREEFLVNGDPLFKNSSKESVLPLGTVTIQETKPPEGYLLNQEIFVVRITPAGTGCTVNTYQEPQIEEKELCLELVKYQEDTDVKIPEVKFEYTMPDGRKEILSTDKNGKLKIRGVRRGIHVLREVAAADGYLLNENEISFEVNLDNEIRLLSQSNTETGEVRFQVTEDGQIQVEVENRTAPFLIEIHKKNEKGKKLSGAEFTLYREKTCENVVEKAVTDDNGMLWMENLLVGETYYLKETKAPQGYRLPTDLFGKPIVYEIRVESIPVQDYFLLYVNGKAYDVEEDGVFAIAGTKRNRQVVISVENETLKKLPATGSSAMLLIVVLLFLFGMISWRDKA